MSSCVYQEPAYVHQFYQQRHRLLTLTKEQTIISKARNPCDIADSSAMYQHHNLDHRNDSRLHQEQPNLPRPSSSLPASTCDITNTLIVQDIPMILTRGRLCFHASICLMLTLTKHQHSTRTCDTGQVWTSGDKSHTITGKVLALVTLGTNRVGVWGLFKYSSTLEIYSTERKQIFRWGIRKFIYNNNLSKIRSSPTLVVGAQERRVSVLHFRLGRISKKSVQVRSFLWYS
jgi:hypothetical protein